MPTIEMAPLARERRPLGSSPGGARHRPPQAGGREGPRVRGGGASRPGPRRSASSGRLRGTRLSLRSAQRCRPEVGVPLPARRSAWWLGHRDVHHPGTALFMTGGVCRRTRSCGFLPVGAGIARRRRAKCAVPSSRMMRRRTALDDEFCRGKARSPCSPRPVRTSAVANRRGLRSTRPRPVFSAPPPPG